MTQAQRLAAVKEAKFESMHGRFPVAGTHPERDVAYGWWVPKESRDRGPKAGFLAQRVRGW